MRLLAAILSFVAFMPSAFAASQWRFVGEQRLQGNTPSQIRTILDQDNANRFEWLRRAQANAMLVNQRIPFVVAINVSVGTYHWDGLSVCDANDPRLNKELTTGAVYFSNGQNSSWNMVLEEKDPCALGFTNPTPQFQ